jgi:hypothetical protein
MSVGFFSGLDRSGPRDPVDSNKSFNPRPLGDDFGYLNPIFRVNEAARYHVYDILLPNRCRCFPRTDRFPLPRPLVFTACVRDTSDLPMLTDRDAEPNDRRRLFASRREKNNNPQSCN